MGVDEGQGIFYAAHMERSRMKYQLQITILKCNQSNIAIFVVSWNEYRFLDLIISLRFD